MPLSSTGDIGTEGIALPKIRPDAQLSWMYLPAAFSLLDENSDQRFQRAHEPNGLLAYQRSFNQLIKFMSANVMYPNRGFGKYIRECLYIQPYPGKGLYCSVCQGINIV